MDWERHNAWARKLDIPTSVAIGVNSLIDGGDEDLSREFEQEKDRLADKVLKQRETAKRDSAMVAIVAYHVDEHDAARKITTDSNIHSAVQLRFLQEKGDEYVTAWYLHHHLDYLWEERSSGKQVQELLAEHKQTYPQTYSADIVDFLLDHEAALKDELTHSDRV